MNELYEQNKAKGLKSFVVFTAGGKELKTPLEKLAGEKKLTLPLAILPGGTGAPDYGAYKINPEASNTVLVYNTHRVHANFVNVDEKSFPDVAKATKEMLGGR